MNHPSTLTVRLVCLLGFILSTVCQAERLHVAVASNFITVMQQLTAAFKSNTGHDLILSTGSTGQLYAQIKQGAPFDVFMAADVSRPQLLIDQGLATQLHIYARGQLALLLNQQPDFNCQSALTSSKLKYLAIANPDLAPYGLAAKQYLQNSQLWPALSEQIVMGENVSQTMHMVVSKNATAGLVAQSMLLNHQITADQCQSLVPNDLYQPINQAMVLLNQAKQATVFNEFLLFMKSRIATDLLLKNGYLVDFES